MRNAIVVALLLMPATAAAQDVDGALWLSADAEIDLGDAVALEIESQVRFGEVLDDHYETIFGAMVVAPVGDVEVGVGYQTNRRVGGATPRREQRLREQVGGRIAKIGRGTLSGRIRIEERWRDDGNDVHLRLRPSLSYSHPLIGGAKWSIGHESFIGSDADWNRQTGWFRMRNRVGVTVPLRTGLAVAVGYLNQYEWGREGARDSMLHVATAGVSLAF